jgi:pimeloyl-ACP methyl ester carboxylesterase
VVSADDGTPLHVEVDEPSTAGTDLTWVFIHGFALSGASWYYQRRDLRPEGRLVFWDHRSHGRSGRARADGVDVDVLGRDLRAVIDAVAPDGPVILVGHSMGGMTVMSCAAHYPQMFGSVVRGTALLATTAGGLSEVTLGLPVPVSVARLLHRVGPVAASVLARRPDLVERGRETGSDLSLLLTRLYSFGSDVPPEVNRYVADMIAATPIDVLAEFLPGLEAHDKRRALEALQHTEVLVMVGESDLLTPPEHSREIVRHVPGAELVLLPSTGHMLTLERHEEVTRALRDLGERVRRHLPDPAAGGSG